MCPRSALNIIASSKGLICGNLLMHNANVTIDLSLTSSGLVVTEQLCQQLSSNSTAVASDARFILLVEKEAIFNRLCEDRVFQLVPLILITGMALCRNTS
jgi:meiotic recombination protein SPO11